MSSRIRTLGEFLESTDAETFAAIHHAPNLIAKIVFGIFAVACFGGLVANSVKIVQLYQQFDTVTNLEVNLMQY